MAMGYQLVPDDLNPKFTWQMRDPERFCAAPIAALSAATRSLFDPEAEPSSPPRERDSDIGFTQCARGLDDCAPAVGQEPS